VRGVTTAVRNVVVSLWEPSRTTKALVGFQHGNYIAK
jgi:hypothetical protein